VESLHWHVDILPSEPWMLQIMDAGHLNSEHAVDPLPAANPGFVPASAQFVNMRLASKVAGVSQRQLLARPVLPSMVHVTVLSAAQLVGQLPELMPTDTSVFPP
jgi:hypothetical protein